MLIARRRAMVVRRRRASSSGKPEGSLIVGLIGILGSSFKLGPSLWFATVLVEGVLSRLLPTATLEVAVA